MATLPPDPWKALGVDKNADKSEIRTAYKKLVLKCHPDKVQDPTLKAQKQDEFQKVQQAYELLNDDAERTKYEDQLKLHELRKQAAMMAKSMPNTSASRSTPPRQHETRAYEIRTVHKPSSSSSPRINIYQTSSRSHEDVPLRYDAPEKTARRPSSFEKASYREEDRRDKDRERERRSRRETEDDYRIKDYKERERLIREKEKELKEKERELRKKSGRDRDVDRKRGQDEKRRAFSPYIEEPNESAEDQQAYTSSKSEKKRSSSKKPYESRDKSTASRRAPSPHVETIIQAPVPPPVPEVKYADDLDKAATYIERSRRQSNRTVQEQPVFSNFPPVVPTPPPAEPHEDDVAHRSRARRSSHDASRSREKLMATRDPYSSSPKSSRVPPPLNKAYTTPLTPHVAEASSPPRSGINRSNTTPLEYSNSAPHIPPTFSRTSTWGAGQEYPHDYARDDDSDDDRHRRHRHRRGERRRSPEAPRSATYKVGADHKTTKVDPYGYGVSPSSTRYAPDTYDHHTSSSSYPTHFKVKESRAYTSADVKYADARYNVAYAQDQYYSVGA